MRRELCPELCQGFSSCCCHWKGSSELPWHFQTIPALLDFPAALAQCGFAVPAPGSAGVPSQSHPVGMCPPGCASLEGLPGDPGGTLGDQDVEVAPGWHCPGQGVLVARGFPPVSALVPFHGPTLSLGSFPSVCF